MLKVPGGTGGVGHLMANLADVKESIATISPTDSVRAAQDAVQWLDAIHGTGEFSIEYSYEVIELIDVALKRHGQRLLDQYLALKPQAKFQEGLLWRAATGYWKALGDAYLGCISHVEADKKKQQQFTRIFRNWWRVQCARRCCRSSGS